MPDPIPTLTDIVNTSAQDKPHRVVILIESQSKIDGVWYRNGGDIKVEGAFTVDELTYKNMLFYDTIQSAMRETIGEEVDGLNAALDAVGGNEAALIEVAKKGGGFRGGDAKGKRDRKRGK